MSYDLRYDLRILLSEAPPPSLPVDAGEEKRWNDFQRTIGTALPADYKWLINTYGSGVFRGILVLWNPFSKDKEINLLKQVTPVLKSFGQRFRGEFPLPCFPEPGGLLPFGGDQDRVYLFWKTLGPPEQWHIVHYKSDDGGYRIYPMGIVEFLVQWIAGRIPDSFLGPGNCRTVVKRDLIFRPFHEYRVSGRPIDASSENANRLPRTVLERSPMTTRDEAIEWFNSQGHYAFEIDTYAEGALFVSTSASDEDETGSRAALGNLVALRPDSGRWIVESVPALGMGDAFEALSFTSLDMAVGAAKALIEPGRHDRKPIGSQ